MKLSVVIPLYNEEFRFASFFPTLHAFLKRHYSGDFEIICVNDGSKDQTRKVVQESQKKYPELKLINSHRNKGKGHALRNGIKKASGDVILFTDIDLSADIHAIPQLVAHIEKGVDFAIASRRLKKSKLVIRQQGLRESLGRVYTKITQFLLNLSFEDMTCGLKAGAHRPMKKIYSKMKINRWSFDPEMLYLAKKYRFKVVEHPVSWVNNTQSKVNILVDAMRSFKEIVLIRWYDVRGKY